MGLFDIFSKVNLNQVRKSVATGDFNLSTHDLKIYTKHLKSRMKDINHDLKATCGSKFAAAEDFCDYIFKIKCNVVHKDFDWSKLKTDKQKENTLRGKKIRMNQEYKNKDNVISEWMEKVADPDTPMFEDALMAYENVVMDLDKLFHYLSVKYEKGSKKKSA